MVRERLSQIAFVVWGCWCAFQLWESYTRDPRVFYINTSAFVFIAGVIIALPIFANLVGKVFGASDPLFEGFWPKAGARKTDAKPSPAQEGVDDPI